MEGRSGGEPAIWLPVPGQIAKLHCKTGGQGRVEPPAFRFSGASAASLHVAGQGLMGDLAAETMARCRLMWPDACRRWLRRFQRPSQHGD